MATRLKLTAFVFSMLLSAAVGAQPAPAPQVAPVAEPQPQPEPEAGTLAARLKGAPKVEAVAPKLEPATPGNVRKDRDERKDADEALGLNCANFMAWLKGADSADLARVDELVAKAEADEKTSKALGEPPKAESDGAKKERERAKADLAAARSVKNSLRVCTKTDTSTLTSAGVGADLVRTVAQVVVDKVQRQGWETLRKEIKTLAKCPSADEKPAAKDTAPKTRYPNLCQIIDTVTIQDLVASPDVLLDALAQDLLAMAIESANLNAPARDALGLFLTSNSGVGAETALKGITDAHRAGAEVLLRRLQRILLERARNEALRSLACKQTWTSPEQALWVAGMCFIEQQSKDALERCDFSAWVAKCQGQPDKAEKVLQFLTAAQEVLGSRASSARAEATIRLVFSLARAEVEEKYGPPVETKALVWLSAFEDTLLGLVNHDWVRVVSGSTRVVSHVIENSCREGECDDDKKAEMKLLSLLAATGNFALTYKNEDKEQAQADREKIMSELVDRMVSRTDKDRGVKFSLGGSLGLFGGVRTPVDFESSQVAFPAQLGLGFGIQTYHSPDVGFHLMVTALDVGQYVTFDNSELEVDEPDVEDAVTLGLTVGGWALNRELPWYWGAYFGCSPFVRTQDGSDTEPTFQAGIVTGFYAPLLDFN